MKVLAILVVILAITGTRGQQEEEINQEAYQKIQRVIISYQFFKIFTKHYKKCYLEQTDFGQTLIDTIQIQLSSGDAVSNLIDLLQGMEQDLRDEQSQDDQYMFLLYAKISHIMGLQQQCDDELNRLQDDVSAARQRISEINTELGEKEPLRDQKAASLERKTNFLQLVRQKQDDLNSRKQLKDQEWHEEQEQHNVAETAIVRAKQIVQDALSQPSSFLEKKQGSENTIFAQISNSINSSLKQYDFKRKGWTSIFQMLASVSTDQNVQANQESIQRIVEICDDILDKISESREIERTDYQHWVDEYQRTYDTLEQRATDTEGEISELNAAIATLTQRINMAKEEVSEQEERVEQKQRQHDEREQWCDDENLGYGNRRQGRDENREVISDAISLLMSQLRTFRRYVGDRQVSVRGGN